MRANRNINFSQIFIRNKSDDCMEEKYNTEMSRSEWESSTMVIITQEYHKNMSLQKQYTP